MANNGQAQQAHDSERSSFVTIDDLIHMSEILFVGLRRLGGYKFPLAVRRGVSELKEQNKSEEARESMSVRAGARTYFFDLEETKEGTSYMLITESRFKGKGKAYARARMAIFPEHAEEFGQAVAEMISKLGDANPNEGD